MEDLGLSAQEASQAALDYMKSRWFLSSKFVFFFNLQIESFLKAGSKVLIYPFLSFIIEMTFFIPYFELSVMHKHRVGGEGGLIAVDK